MTGAMIHTASNGVVELQSDLDILKGVARWAVRRKWEGDGQRSTRHEGALPGYEGLGSLLQGEYRRRQTMGAGAEVVNDSTHYYYTKISNYKTKNRVAPSPMTKGGQSDQQLRSVLLQREGYWW
ncbi:hypothetical protein EDB86DRAFT_2839386 [Lactarius hatsudake]|nr:hypothetical protein EDB86DRAFT_2839386 [Lactarius hatsudake]